MLGNQFLLPVHHELVVDLFAGVGYGFGHNPRNESWHYGFLGAENDTPLTLTAGIKIGFLLGKK